MSGFSPAWLRRREPVDAAARDAGLGQRFAAALPRAPRLIDLGAGTGANARALAPVIGGDQTWLLVDHDPALQARQHAAFFAWARSRGDRARAENGAVVIAVGERGWRFESMALDLAAALPPAAADGITCAAFLDLASVAWLARFAAWLAAARLPLLAVLSVDGRRCWSPPAPEDALVAASFRRHQEGDKGFGPAAGGGAADRLARQLQARGFAVATAASDWRLGGAGRQLVTALVRGEAAAARGAAPDAAAAIASWRRRRLAQAAAGDLAVTIGHCDLLALPRFICDKPWGSGLRGGSAGTPPITAGAGDMTG